MSRLRFSFPKGLVVPDNFRYQHVDGHQTLSSDPVAWYAAIAKHEKDNGRELPEDWKEAAMDQLCRILPPGWCQYENGDHPTHFMDVRLTAGDFVRGMDVLLSIVVSPDPLVDKELAESRARICAQCPANINIEGCAPCTKISEKVASIKGSGETTSDPHLKQCAACACANRAAVWIKPELLRRGVDQEQMNKLRTQPWCWKWKEIDAL